MKNKIMYFLMVVILIGMGYLIYSNHKLKKEIGNSRQINSRTNRRTIERRTSREQPTMNDEIDELKENLDEANNRIDELESEREY